jgi:F-type H+-transporting ATPase subunit epsilon
MSALLNEAVTYASIPGWDGLFGVMHGGSPLVARLGTGELRLDFPDTPESKGGSRSYFIDGGFAKMSKEGLSILAETAIPVEALGASEAKAELAEAMARQADVNSPDALAQADKIAADRNRARTKLRLAQQARVSGI